MVKPLQPGQSSVVMINTCNDGSASSQSKHEMRSQEKDLQELAENDDTVYKVYDFRAYPLDMSQQDRLVYQILLSQHP